MARTAWNELRALAGARNGVISTKDAYARGLTRANIRSALSGGEFEMPHRGVLVVTASPRTWEQEYTIAAKTMSGLISHCAAGRVHRLDNFDALGSSGGLGRSGGLASFGRLGGLAGFAGFDGFDLAPPEIVVESYRRPRADHWIIHTSQLETFDADIVSGIPVTVVERTLVDLAEVLDTATMQAVLLSALRRGVPSQWIANYVSDRPNSPGAIRLARALVRPERLGTLPGRLLESIVDKCVEDGSLPTPVRDLKVIGGSYLPITTLAFAWPHVGLAVEPDSRFWNIGRKRVSTDDIRNAELEGLGWQLLYSTEADHVHPDQFVRRVLEAYKARASLAR